MNKFIKDYSRHNSSKGIRGTVAIIRRRDLLALYLLRKADTLKGFWSGICRKIGSSLLLKKGIEITTTKNIGGGLLLVHPFNIGINPRAIIGEDFTIFKGATIGSVRSGERAGAPNIGDRVTVCQNAFVCGNVHIGDDVLITANCFVNTDIPSNSIVVCRPGIVMKKDNPSADYL